MKILIVHNRYQQPGGEDAVVKTEFELLKSFGQEVRLYERSNDELNAHSPIEKLRFFWNLGWSEDSYQDMRRLLREFRPQVVHFHNIFFTLTPSVYQACRDENVPVVQSLHNFRLLCSNALFFRNGHACEECLEHKDLWRGVRYGCYRKSRLATAFMVRMLNDHWKKGTWVNMVDGFITATEFGRSKYITGGIPAEKIMVKPNISPDGISGQNRDEGYALFAGRLTPEKGVKVLLDAWKKKSPLPLKIVGDGPLLAELKREARTNNDIEFLGFVSPDQFKKCLKGAKFLIVPSLCYENFPRVIAEAYSYGVPVVASDLGGFPEFVLEGKTGLLFRAGDADDLLEKVEWFIAHPDERRAMQENIRKVYETTYSARHNYELLMGIYQQIIARKNLSANLI